VLESLANGGGLSPADRLVRLIFLLANLRDAGARSRTAIIPYLAYARKDRRTQLRDPVNTRYVAELLEAAGITHLITLDVHNPAALDNAFRIPVDHLSALPMMTDHYASRLSSGEPVVVSPDVGGVKRAQIFQELLEVRFGRPVELAFVEKRRASGKVTSGRLVGNIEGRHALIIDDLCATGGTLVRAAERCRAAGAASVHVAVTHAPLPQGLETLASCQSIDEIAVTDSTGLAGNPSANLQTKLTTLSVAPLFGLAVRRIHQGKPVAPLLSRWPLSEET
jgi:ribose-phosphate pyrophosphokinase